MQTKLITQKDIELAAECLLDGQLVAFPTETVYGLGADATNEEAVSQIYQAKGRPNDNPLIAHIASLTMLEEISQDLPKEVFDLAEKFWPGPLTMIVSHNGKLAPSVTAGLETVGVRMPAHPLALELIKAVDRPLAAPSANRSGRPSPTLAEHVYEDLKGRIAGILDGGATKFGVESTVLDLTSDLPTILRPGAITAEELAAIIGPVAQSGDTKSASSVKQPKAPGMKYKHYSPNVPVYMNACPIPEAVDLLENRGLRVGLLADNRFSDFATEKHLSFYNLGEPDDIQSANHYLFAGLRDLEKSGVDVILVQTYSKAGAGQAYMNRLEKAAAGKYIK